VVGKRRARAARAAELAYVDQHKLPPVRTNLVVILLSHFWRFVADAFFFFGNSSDAIRIIGSSALFRPRQI